MIPASFDYHRAASLDEAIRLLQENDDAKLLAGGHSLLPMMKLRLAIPSLLIDIGGLAELRFIAEEEDELLIGAMSTHDDVASSPAVAAALPAMSEAAAAIGDVQVRNHGTVGGSLAHADPAADYGAAVLALGATVDITGPEGVRSIPVAELFAGLLSTSLAPAELITAVRFPTAIGLHGAYEKFAQPASGFAIVGVAAVLAVDDAGRCTTARVAATGVSDRPLRLRSVESGLVGTALDGAAIEAATASADDGIDEVRADLYAAEDYRRHLLRVIAARAVTRAGR